MRAGLGSPRIGSFSVMSLICLAGETHVLCEINFAQVFI